MSDEQAMYAWLFSSYGHSGDSLSFYQMARRFEANNELKMAATAYDRAYGLQPGSKEIAAARLALLDKLAIIENGIRFRFVPAGSFLMGFQGGEQDEQPVHPVQLKEFWISETPVSWATFCDLMNWEPPPTAAPRNLTAEENTRDHLFKLRETNKICLQYCEDGTLYAKDWHAHANRADLFFGRPGREDPRRPVKFDRKPMISVAWQDAQDLCHTISTEKIVYRLPTEAEWEKAARGGLINCTYPWGNDAPTNSNCDFNRFNEFSILPMRRFKPNGYGLYSMSGSVWEWTSDWYSAEYYETGLTVDPKGPANGTEKVLRGGSWADCSEVITVSFRMSRNSSSWRSNERWGGHMTPNISFRICREELSR